jgi:hypothetical protein
MKRFVFYTVTAFSFLAAHADTVNLQVSLSTPVVSLQPGSTVEWFAALSDPTDLGGGLSVLITGSSFDVPCQGCAPPAASNGTYSDLIGAGFVVLAPAGNCCGDPQTILGEPIGSFAVSPSSPFGPLSGFLEIDYALFSNDPNDPNFNPDTQTVNPDVKAFSPVQVNVVPEPSTISLLVFAGVSVSVGSAFKLLR